MAGKNSRFSKLLQTIGIVDDMEDDYNDNRDSSYNGRESSDFRSANQRDFGNRSDSYYGHGNSGARDFEEDAFSSRYNQSRSQNSRQGNYSQNSQNNGFSQRGNVTQMPPRGNYQQESSFNSRSGGRSGFESRQSGRNSQAESRQYTAIYAIRTLEECREVIVDLIEGKTTVVNLEDLRSDLQQRAIDTLSGASFALNAVLRKASDKIYLIAPAGVQVDDMGASERRR